MSPIDLDTLVRDGYLFLPEFLNLDEVVIIRKGMYQAQREELRTLPSGLLGDRDDLCNRVYQSARSPGVSYCYLHTAEVMRVNSQIANRLQQQTKMPWHANINRHMLPMFLYGPGAFIKAHRDRDFGYGSVDFVIVVGLTSPGITYEGGDLYLNSNVTVSPDGKVVTGDQPEDRISFVLPMGGALLFDNRRFVHGTTPVTGGDFAFRATCAWRTSQAMSPSVQPDEPHQIMHRYAHILQRLNALTALRLQDPSSSELPTRVAELKVLLAPNAPYSKTIRKCLPRELLDTLDVGV